MTPADFGIEPVGVYTDVSEQGNPLSELKLYTEADMQKYAREVAIKVARKANRFSQFTDFETLDELVDEVMGEKS